MNQPLSAMIKQTDKSGLNLCYLLQDSAAFSPVGYKMLQGQLETGFLSCVQYRCNGNPKLMYLASGKKPLSVMSGQLGEDDVIRLTDKMLGVVEQLGQTGFLNLNNVERSEDRIFVDTTTMDCYFIFLPLNNGGAGTGREEFEMDVIRTLRSVVVAHAGGAGFRLRGLAAELSGDGAQISRIRQYVKGMTATVSMENAPAVRGPGISGPTGAGRKLHFVGVGTPVSVDFVIRKPEFIVGKSVNGVDGTLTFNNAISRIHCRISVIGKNLFLTDLGSSNGTFINGKRIVEGKPTPVKEGDEIKLANSCFVLRGD